MAVLTEGKHTGEFLVSEAPGTISRETVTVTVGAATELEPGAVLGKITATGKYVPYDDGAADGSEVAAGILYAAAENAGGAPLDVRATIIDALAEVRAADLVWQAGVDEAGGLVDLRARYIKAR